MPRVRRPCAQRDALRAGHRRAAPPPRARRHHNRHDALFQRSLVGAAAARLAPARAIRHLRGWRVPAAARRGDTPEREPARQVGSSRQVRFHGESAAAVRSPRAPLAAVPLAALHAIYPLPLPRSTRISITWRRITTRFPPTASSCTATTRWAHACDLRTSHRSPLSLSLITSSSCIDTTASVPVEPLTLSHHLPPLASHSLTSPPTTLTIHHLTPPPLRDSTARARCVPCCS